MTQEQKVDNMRLDQSVIDTIISMTASDVEGVASVGGSAPSGFLARLTSKPARTGIDCITDENGKLVITIHIEVYFGYVIPDVAERLRNAIVDALNVQVGLEVSAIDIFVDAIQFSTN